LRVSFYTHLHSFGQTLISNYGGLLNYQMMSAWTRHQCSKGFWPRLFSIFYPGSRTEAYWGEAKRGNFWPRVLTEAKTPSFCLRYGWTEAIYLELTTIPKTPLEFNLMIECKPRNKPKSHMNIFLCVYSKTGLVFGWGVGTGPAEAKPKSRNKPKSFCEFFSALRASSLCLKRMNA